jgi:hypothetical protein
MKKVILLITLLASVCITYAQTVENIRVVQDGENLKINYRIGASTDAQLYNVYLSCSMNGGRRFEPKAVIGDVGENIIGGRSFYTIIWDVFEDVDEVVNPEFFVRVELVSDMSAPAVQPQTNTPTQTREVTEEKPVEQPGQKEVKQEETKSEPGFNAEETSQKKNFKRNGFLSLSGITGFGVPLGISFGSLNNWGYYVTVLRLGIEGVYTYDYEWQSNEPDLNLHFMTSAGVTKHIVSAGFYRLHGYGGIGGHLRAMSLYYNPEAYAHFVLETGVINVLGPVNLTAGITFPLGIPYPYSIAHFVFGVGLVF